MSDSETMHSGRPKRRSTSSEHQRAAEDDVLAAIGNGGSPRPLGHGFTAEDLAPVRDRFAA